MALESIKVYKKIIFYSWQSDLPNSTNRGFIEDAICKAIKKLKKDSVLQFDVALDRDTSGKSGSLDIANTIFEKVRNCNVFIADVSFVTSDAKRKHPNPNVLLESGYAAKSIGWESIIFIFNKSTGKIEDLPFDLRSRKIIQYEIEDQASKAKVKEHLVSHLCRELDSIITERSNKERIFEHLKTSLDAEITVICNRIRKILDDYGNELDLNRVFEISSLSQSEINEKLVGREYIGFQVLKLWDDTIEKLNQIIDNPLFSKHIEDDKIAPIIDLIRALVIFNENVKQRSLFKPIQKQAENREVVKGKTLNPGNPDNSYLLLSKKKGAKAGKVIDSGSFSPYHEKLLLEKLIETENVFSLLVFSVINPINEILNSWGNSLLLDPAMFRTN